MTHTEMIEQMECNVNRSLDILIELKECEKKIKTIKPLDKLHEIQLAESVIEYNRLIKDVTKVLNESGIILKHLENQIKKS